HLREEDLPVALEWVPTLDVENTPRDAVRDLAQEIMVLGFAHLDDAHVCEGLARVILRRPAHIAFGHEPLGSEIQAMIAADDRRRHILAKAVFDGLRNPNAAHHRLRGWQPRLVLSSDVPWIISELERESHQSRPAVLPA